SDVLGAADQTHMRTGMDERARIGDRTLADEIGPQLPGEVELDVDLCDTGRFSAMHSSHQDRKADLPYERLRQRDHAAPELLTLAGIDIVFAYECERAVGIDAVDRDAGGQRLDRVGFAHQQRLDARRQQQPSARIDAEGAQLNAVTLDRLDQVRLAGLLINCEDRNVILALIEDLSALQVHLVLIAVGDTDEAAVRMDVDCSRALARFDVDGVGQGLLHKERIATQHAVGLKLVGIEFVLPLDRDIDPRRARVKIKMPWSEAQAASGRDRSKI